MKSRPKEKRPLASKALSTELAKASQTREARQAL